MNVAHHANHGRARDPRPGYIVNEIRARVAGHRSARLTSVLEDVVRRELQAVMELERRRCDGGLPHWPCETKIATSAVGGFDRLNGNERPVGRNRPS